MTNLLKLFSLETLDELDHLGVAMDVKYIDQLLPAWLICGLVFNQFSNYDEFLPNFLYDQIFHWTVFQIKGLWNNQNWRKIIQYQTMRQTAILMPNFTLILPHKIYGQFLMW